jgi:hypothetical protein
MGFRRTILGLLIFGLSECSQDNRHELNSDYHRAIDALLKEKFGDAKFLIQIELKPLYKTMFAGLQEIEAEQKYGRENLMYLDKAFLDYLVKEQKLDQRTAEQMFGQVDSTKIFDLSPEKLPQQTIKAIELSAIFDGGRGAHGKLESRYGTSCIIKFSYPVFNKDKSALFFSMDRSCGPLNGDGTIYYMVKIDGRWTLIDEQEMWAS